MSTDQIYSQLLDRLSDTYGPMIAGQDLARVLGYRTMSAFRQALRRNQIKVPLMDLPHRQQKFALTIDVANWLIEHRSNQFEEERIKCRR